MLRTGGFDGDQIWEKYHGGPHQAVCVYLVEHYDDWAREFDLRFPWGQFGENLSVKGMLEDEVHIGDVFRVGGALVQITRARGPCYKLAARLGSDALFKAILPRGRTGYYMRVLEEGEVGAGDVIELVEADRHRMSVHEMCRLFYLDTDDLEGARRASAVEALAPNIRERFAKRVEKG